MTHVCYFRHALALDERRVKFLPEYAYGGKATNDQPQGANNPTTQDVNPKPGDPAQPEERCAVADSKAGKTSSQQRPHTLEVWFAGTHSDM